MSTEFRVHGEDGKEVWITEQSARYDLDLSGYLSDADGYVAGPQQMSAQEALKLAAGIIYAVWCSSPDEADKLVGNLSADIPTEWNQIQRRS